MSSYQSQYADITRRLIESPKKIGDSRIGKINSNFVETLRIDLEKEFPIMDIKWIKFSNVVHELLWMLRGDTNPKYLIENGCHIWTDDAYRYYKDEYSPHKNDDEEITKEEFVKKILNFGYLPSHNGISYLYGNLDKIYGYQWRSFNDQTDQVQNVLDKLKENPDDRRMIIIAHNPTDLENGEVGLPSCHNYMSFYTRVGEDGRRKLSTYCNIRSNDWFLGQPYNVIQYALITHIFAKLSDMDVDELVINAVDAHLYHIHFEPAKIWLDRYYEISGKRVFSVDVGNIPEDEIDEYIAKVAAKFKEKIPIDEDFFLPIKPSHSTEIIDNSYCKAKIEIIGEQKTIDDFKFEDFVLTDYNPQKYIKAQLLS
jgi:thymidylate synthase